jgi:hypothetical protein
MTFGASPSSAPFGGRPPSTGVRGGFSFGRGGPWPSTPGTQAVHPSTSSTTAAQTSAQSLLDAAEAVASSAWRPTEVLDDTKVRERLSNVLEALRRLDQASGSPGWDFVSATRCERIRARLQRIENDLWLRVSERGLHILAVQARAPTIVNGTGAVAANGASPNLGSSVAGLADLLDLHPSSSSGSPASTAPQSRSSFSFGNGGPSAAPAATTEGSGSDDSGSSSSSKTSKAALKERRKLEGLFEPTGDDAAKLMGAAMQALSGMTAKSTPFDQLVQRRLRVLQRVHAALAEQRKQYNQVPAVFLSLHHWGGVVT